MLRFKKVSVHNGIVYAALLSQVLTWIGLPLKINILVSCAVALTTVSAAVALGMLLLDTIDSTPITNIFIWLLGILFWIVLSLFMTSAINGDALKKVVIFLQLPMLLYVAQKADGGRVRDAVYTVNAFFPILFLYYYNSSIAHRYIGQYGEMVLEEITLGFNNSNEAAMYLMVCTFILLAALFRYKSVFKRIVLGIEVLFMLYLIYKTNCRAVIFLTAILSPLLILRVIKLRRITMQIIFGMPILFSIIVLVFPPLGDMLFMGESLDTGRSMIYAGYFENVTFDSLLFGDFRMYPLNNMHNAFITLMASFGCITAISYWFFLRRGFQDICCHKKPNVEQRALQAGCVAIVMHTTVEAAWFTSGAIYAVSVFLVLFLTASAEKGNG